MARIVNHWKDVSFLVFGLRIKSPDAKFYHHLREHIHNQESLKPIISVIQEFPQILVDLAQNVDSVAHWLSKKTYVNDLVEWISGRENNLAESTSGYVILPLLAVIQLVQYLEFLTKHNVDHNTFISHIRNAGGVQGFCGGLPCGLAVASACSEADLMHKFAVSVRLAFVIGIVGEMADDRRDTFGMLVIRLAYPGQSDALMELFPDIAIAAVTDPRSITVSGSSRDISALETHVKRKGMHVQQWPLRGKWHHPQNLAIAQTLSVWCGSQPKFDYQSTPRAGDNPMSNHTGDCIPEGQFTDELIFGILARRSDWYNILKKVAERAQRNEASPFRILNFGIGDCVPLTAFNEFNVSVEKSSAHALFCNALRQEQYHVSADDLPYTDQMVAVVGVSCRLPGANNLAELWRLLLNAEDRCQELNQPRFDVSKSHRFLSAQAQTGEKKLFANLLDDVESFDNTFFAISSKEAESMDPQQRIMLELAYEAMESSGYTSLHQHENGDDIGCFIGVSASDYHENTNGYEPSAYTSTGTMRSFISGRISHYFGWTGPSEVIDTACSSSLVAIHRACRALAYGECVMALAGGVNVMTSPNGFFDLSQAGFLSPTGQCRPFDRTADGYCRAEGAGLVALKLLGQARRDNDPILAVIPGSHVNQSGPASLITVPHLKTQVDLFQQAARKANVDAAGISYVEAHGTGTQVGDPIEMNSLRRFFSTRRSDPVYVGSIKGNVGHCEAAAGVAGLLKVIAMLQHARIPPQANFHVLNPKIGDLALDDMVITTKPLKWHARHRIALVNSYGASGANAAVVVRSAPETRATQADLPLPTADYDQPIILSAATRVGVQAYAKVLSDYLAKAPDHFSFQDIAFTLNSWRKAYQHRIVVDAKDRELLRLKLMSAKFELFHVDSKQYSVILTLSGQSSKVVGLSRAIYDRYFRFREHLDECNQILVDMDHPAIIPAVFSSEDIEDPVTLQTAMVATQISFALCWLESGVRIHAVLGHSLGELAALAITGALSVCDCLKLVAYRAQLIQSKWGTDKGAMLAVSSSPSKLERLMDQMTSNEITDVEVACFNSDTSLVLAGPSRAIDRFEQSFGHRGSEGRITTHRLNVSHGFHSKLTSPILEDLGTFAGSLQWKQPSIHLETCSDDHGNGYASHDPSEHARRPVFFEKAVQRLEKRFGACAWLEAGMNTPIVSLARKATLWPSEHRFFTVSTKSADLDTDVVSATVHRLWREGIGNNSWAHLEFPSCKQTWLPPYQFDKHHHWLPYIQTSSTDAEQNAKGPGAGAPPPVRKMVTLISHTEAMNSTLFLVDVDTDRFAKVSDGYRVRQSPMVPITLYLECAAMAMRLLDTSIEPASIQFSKVDYHNPGCLNRGQTVSVVLRRTDGPIGETHFEVKSTESSVGDSQGLLLVSGKITRNLDPEFDVFERLLGPSQDTVPSDTLRSVLVYRLLDSTARYATFFKGIESISLAARQATATVRLPIDQPGVENSDARSILDAVTVDIFIQPLIVLVSSSDLIDDEKPMWIAGIDRICFTSSRELHVPETVTVFAKISIANNKDVVGDIVIHSSDGSLVGVVIGCRFSGTTPSGPEISVAPTTKNNHEGRTSHELGESRIPTSPLSGIDQAPHLPDNKTYNYQSTTQVNDAALASSLKLLLGNYLKYTDTAVSDSMRLSDMGLDSLAALGLSAELRRNYGMAVNPMNLLGHSLRSLLSVRRTPEIPVRSTRTSPASSCAERDVDTLQDILAECSGFNARDIDDSMTLDEIGIDSLLSMEVQREISEKMSVDVSIYPDSTVGDVAAVVREKLKFKHLRGT